METPEPWVSYAANPKTFMMYAMAKLTTVALCVLVLLAGCKKQAETSANSSAMNSAAAQASTAGGSAAPQYGDPSTVSAATRSSDSVAGSGTPQPSDPPAVIPRYSDPPGVDVGLSVEQAYAAIPHRRTVWGESDSSVPAQEKAYLRVIFQVVDEAVAVRVTGLQNFSSQRFDAVDVDGQFERLISFARAMPVPARLGAYHNDILQALASDRQFFNDWRSQRDKFPFAQQIAGHAGVQAASAAARAAYGELMSKYPGESQANKEAFFDYHCALDFL